MNAGRMARGERADLAAFLATLSAGLRTRSPDQLPASLRKHLEPVDFRRPSAAGWRSSKASSIIRTSGAGLATRAIPPERLLLVLRWALIAPDIGSLWQIRGVRLVATDLSFSAGVGPEARGAGEALLMTIACRRRVVSELSGPGQAKFAKRVNHR